MSDYKPTTELIRGTVIEAIVEVELHDQAKQSDGALVTLTKEYKEYIKDEAGRVFDDWHADELRKARVEAIREAAEAMYKSKGYALLEEDGESYSIGKDNASIVEDWLLDRADREEDQ